MSVEEREKRKKASWASDTHSLTLRGDFLMKGPEGGRARGAPTGFGAAGTSLTSLGPELMVSSEKTR